MEMLTLDEAVEALRKVARQMSSVEPEQRPVDEDDYACCSECDHVEMCRWYPMYGCEFKSRPSAEPAYQRMPDACRACSNNPQNGGSGICHCTLGQTPIT